MAFTFIDPRRHRKVRRRRIAKSVESQRVLAALDAYLEGNFEEPVKWLVRFWRDQAAVFTYQELRSLVTDEDAPEELFNTWFQDYSKFLGERMTPMWESAFAAGANSNPVTSGTGITVDNSDTFVREWITGHTGDLITRVTEDQVNAVRYIIAESKAVRMGSAETARYIRSIVGLTERQAEANLKHYTSVKEKLTEDHPRMRPETIERKARESAAKYAQKQQMYRAETISRTEIAQAYNQGNDAIIKQAMEQGLIPIQKKVWSTAMDGHVCEACEALEGVEIDMDKEFSATIGVKVRRTLTTALPPMHPRCKCAVMYESTGEYMTPASEPESPTADFSDTQTAYLGLEESWKKLGENEQVNDVNPDGRNDNCVNCTIAYEMRSRDRAVVATQGIDQLIIDPFAGWNSNEDPIDVDPNRETQDYIRSAMSLWGDGARAQIAVRRQALTPDGLSNLGHSFVAIQRNGATFFIDPQDGKGYNNIEELNDYFESCLEVKFLRIDKAELNELGFSACREVD